MSVYVTMALTGDRQIIDNCFKNKDTLKNNMGNCILFHIAL